MGKAHICYTCHLLRHCKECSHICKHKCQMRHDCEIRVRGMTESEGWSWYYNVTQAIDPNIVCSMYPGCIPDYLEKIVKRMLKKPIQLKLFE